MLNILACQINGLVWDEGTLLIPKIIILVVNLIKIAVPIILIIMGMLDLAKAVMSNDEKEMKGAQTKLIKRVIYAILVFLVVAIVQLIFGTVANNTNDQNAAGCIACFVTSTDNCK